MSLPIVLRPAAVAELDDARLWYDARHPGLGDAFVACIDAALEQISAGPTTFACVHDNVRRNLVRRFPYAVFYVIEPERVVVLAIFHASRDPTIWQGRR